jgi:hypothetical protein
MKSPTEIRDKTKQIQFEYLKAFYRQHLVKEPQNCAYNREITIQGSSERGLRVCTYFSDDSSFQVCNTNECSKSCNAFVARMDKSQLRAKLEEDIREHPVKYPEIMVLNWVLDKEKLPDEKPNIIERLKLVAFETTFFLSELFRRIF